MRKNADIYDLLTSAAQDFLSAAKPSLARCHARLHDAVRAENTRRKPLNLPPLDFPTRAVVRRAIRLLDSRSAS